ncbi:MAG TPA: hypothetical protein PK894_00020 [Defluviitoga sp.]|nr:hypothetical protein [Defluviitoga sp.]HOP24323.1 hypothetical protein [Defluviitoga sp.]HPZ28085.1 hypothetical protein [Defluviitoga sp.]HQD61975.1 hypothetical protein [Defluviitoga sp.]
MKKFNFVILSIISLLLISGLSFTQVSDSVSIPVFISIPSYASIEVEAERLDYVLDLSDPQNTQKKVRVKVIANSSNQVDVEFISSVENPILSEFLVGSFIYNLNSNVSNSGIVEKVVSVGFNFQNKLQNDSEVENELLKLGEFNEKIGTVVFTVSTI